VSDALTIAVRTRSADLLRDDLVELLMAGESAWVQDYRELMLNLAPYHGCARRIGKDPAALFADAAARGSRGLFRALCALPLTRG
jgi:hypothetical protein